MKKRGQYLKRDPDDLYIDAKKRAMKAIRGGKFDEADRWIAFAERLSRLDVRRSNQRTNYGRLVLAQQQRADRLKANCCRARSAFSIALNSSICSCALPPRSACWRAPSGPFRR